jgi:hypothetical protein
MHPPNGHYKRLRRAPRALRIAVGILLVIGGAFGFLPILGFWMIPLGLAVIFIDSPVAKRAWSRLRSRWRSSRARPSRSKR